MEMTLRTDRLLVRAESRSTRYLMIRLNAHVAEQRAGRMPVNIGIALDRSGSMEADRKFELARTAVLQAVAMLQCTDRFTLVAYDDEVEVLTPSVLADAAAKDMAVRRLSDVGPRGSTDLHAGWEATLQQIRSHMAHNCVNRVLLLSDGLANMGVTDPDVLKRFAEQNRRAGITTSTFGVGEDFDEQLLRDVAEQGGGNAYYVESPVQIADLLTSELGEALEVVHRDVVVQLTLPPGADGKLLNRNRHAVNDDQLTVQLGDLVSGQEVTLVVRLTMPEDRVGARTGGRVAVHQTSGDPAAPTPETLLSASYGFTYADHDTNDVQPRDREVDREVAALYAGRARATATEANRQGDYAYAKGVLQATARRIRHYATGDEVLEALWRKLEAEVQTFTRRLSAKERKLGFFLAQAEMSNRDPQGKARRPRR